MLGAVVLAYEALAEGRGAAREAVRLRALHGAFPGFFGFFFFLPSKRCGWAHVSPCVWHVGQLGWCRVSLCGQSSRPPP